MTGCGAADAIVFFSTVLRSRPCARRWSRWCHQRALCGDEERPSNPRVDITATPQGAHIGSQGMKKGFFHLPRHAPFPRNSHNAGCKVRGQNQEQTRPVVNISAAVEASRASSQIKATHSLCQRDIVSPPPSIKSPIQPP